MAESPTTDYSRKGKPTLVFGQRGFSEDSLHHPRGLTLTRDNNIAIANSKTNEIKVFTLSGQFVKSYKLHSVNLMIDNGITALTTDTHGNLVASYTDNHEVQVLVTGSGKLKRRLTMDTKERFTPWGLVCDNKNNTYVCDRQNSCIRVFTLDGKYQRDIGKKGTGIGELMDPVGIAMMPDGKLAVTDFENNNIQIFNTQGVSCSVYGSDGMQPGQFKQPFAIAVDRTGHMVVSEWKNNRIQVLDVLGNSVATFGQHGAEEGEFFSPSGIAITTDARIVVSDFNNNRIQIF